MKTVMWLIVGLALSPILVELLGEVLPGGRVLVPVMLALGGLRLLLTFFIGSRAADHAIGRLAYDVIVFPFRVCAAALGFAVGAARPDRW